MRPPAGPSQPSPATPLLLSRWRSAPVARPSPPAPADPTQRSGSGHCPEPGGCAAHYRAGRRPGTAGLSRSKVRRIAGTYPTISRRASGPNNLVLALFMNTRSGSASVELSRPRSCSIRKPTDWPAGSKRSASRCTDRRDGTMKIEPEPQSCRRLFTGLGGTQIHSRVMFTSFGAAGVLQDSIGARPRRAGPAELGERERIALSHDPAAELRSRPWRAHSSCFIRSHGAAGLFYGRRRWSARARKTKKFGISDTTGVVTAVAPSERHFPAILILM